MSIGISCNGDNSIWFSGLLGGCCVCNGKFLNSGDFGYLWSSNEYNSFSSLVPNSILQLRLCIQRLLLQGVRDVCKLPARLIYPLNFYFYFFNKCNKGSKGFTITSIALLSCFIAFSGLASFLVSLS